MVSKVLRGGRSTVGASSATRQRVLRAARELGYRPHAASQALRSQRFGSIGVLMGGADEFYLPQRVMGSLSRTLAARNRTCTLVCTEGFDAQSLLANPLLKSRIVDVVVIGYVYEPPLDVVQAIDELAVPSLWLNRMVETDGVYVDEAGAAGQLVHHMAGLGHQQIGYVNYSTDGRDDSLAARRLGGLAGAARDTGVQVSRVIQRSVPRGERQQATREWLLSLDRPSAFIVHSLSAAQAIMQTAVQLGLRIPDDLAIASFDNGGGCDANIPAITCAIHPEIEFGRTAAEMALEKAASPQSPLPSRCLRYTLAIGGSTVNEDASTPGGRMKP